jgi:hypothetical protein
VTTGSKNCAVSTLTRDRLDPLSNIGDILSDTQFYDIQPSNQSPTYDASISGTRDKTVIEQGLCASIPQPKCNAIDETSASNSDNKATWPETVIGLKVTGSCISGYWLHDIDKPLSRYCLAKAESESASFEDLEPDFQCVPQQTNNFPASYSDTATFSSDFFSNFYIFGNTVLDSNTRLQNGIYHTSFSFTLNDVASIMLFKLQSIAYQDYVIVTINDQVIFNKPNDFNRIASLQNGSYSIRTGVYHTDNIAIDLVPYLKIGQNNLQFYVVSTNNSGGLFYRIQYSGFTLIKE